MQRLSFWLVLVLAAALLPGMLRPAYADDKPFRDLGEAPELTNDIWINSPKPLRLADLRGKVVLLEFWTFGCYNCKNTLPYVTDAYAKYKEKGVEFIGIHYPEFSYERDVNNVRAFVKQEGINYPVAIDNEGIAWNAYQMHAWPAFIIVDKAGHMRFRQIGEGRYEQISAALDMLLTEPAPKGTTHVPDDTFDYHSLSTP